MRLTLIMPSVFRRANYFVFFCVFSLAAVSVQAQMAATYRAAAQSYREAAAKTKSAHNRSCYLANANYYDCVAAQFGPNGPRSCTQPSCSYEPEPGGATGGSTAPVNTGSSGEDVNGRMQEILDRNERDREVREEERREREDASNLEPVQMSPAGNDALKDLTSGADAVDRLGVPGTKRSEDTSGLAELSPRLENASDRPESFALPDGSGVGTDFISREEQLKGDKTDSFYRPGDPRLADLYTPGTTGRPEGWGIVESNPRSIDDIPTSITFGPEGMTVVQYGDRTAIPKTIEFLGDDRSVVTYGPDANYSQGATITYEDGRVVGVQGPIDNRTPTILTYDSTGRVVTSEHGPARQVSQTLSNVGNQPTASRNESVVINNQKQLPTSFLSDKPSKMQPPASNNLQPQTVDTPGLWDRTKEWVNHQKERFNTAVDGAKEWWNENVTRRVANAQQCLSDPLECATHLGEASK